MLSGKSITSSETRLQKTLMAVLKYFHYINVLMVIDLSSSLAIGTVLRQLQDQD